MARPRGVVDGQQAEIPVLLYNRTVGTQKESASREWRDRCKRGRSVLGKAGTQSEDVMRSESIVAKRVSWLPRKAAIVCRVPVP